MPDDKNFPVQSLPERIWKTYKIPLLLTLVSLVLIAVSAVLLVKSIITVTPITFEEGSAKDRGEAGEKITVDIAGAVNKPGVYSFSKGVRLEEAISAAGGLSGEANTEFVSKNLNRAAVLSDGSKIFIPKNGESSVLPANIVRRDFQSVSEGENYVNINSAGVSELDTLPGVGPATAAKIISGRPYGSLDDLVAKKVIGQSLFEKIKNQLSL